ncbi:MAG TPA: hypothetical protein VMR41_00595 [Patescibacteria group bacterium]|nr:hypothetical protein [Patescibacteria group bacterium]
MNEFKNKITQTLAIFLIFTLLFAYSVPYKVFADGDDATPTDTQTQTDTNTPTPDQTTPTTPPSDTVIPTETGSADTVTPTTADVSPTEISNQNMQVDDSSDTPTPDSTIDNSADISNIATASADTGDNSIDATSSSSTATDDQTQDSDSSQSSSSGNSNNSSGQNSSSSNITTGDATSSVDTQNIVNTTSINSQVVRQTINLFVDQNGDLNLSSPSTLASDIVSAHPDDPEINVKLTDINNYTYLSNTIISTANSGNNQINVGGDAEISTGNACSLVSFLNQVNFTIINSTIHIITINVFGNLNGNIILPENITSAPTDCPECSISANINNTAVVNNSVNASADSGDNNLTTTDSSASGSITTGSAQTAVDALNVVNTNANNVNFGGLYINLFGTWNGKFLGWNNLDPQNGGASLALESLTANQTSDSTSNTTYNINNTAVVNNDIISSANTGGNTINAASGAIQTGNALSEVSLFNFVNSNIINSSGYFGFINIFGNLNGDIGGENEFITPISTPNPGDNGGDNSGSSGSGSSNSDKEDGGALSLSQTNNVGDYVFPGDTVTVFLTGKNTGTGKVYGATLTLHLMKDGIDMGDPSYSIGDIPAGVSFSLTSGLVLSEKAEPGEYISHAVLSGTTGNDDTGVSAGSDSSFQVRQNGTFISNLNATSNTPPQSKPHKSVLGLLTSKKIYAHDSYLIPVLWMFIVILVLMKIVRDRSKLTAVWYYVAKRKRNNN